MSRNPEEKRFPTQTLQRGFLLAAALVLACGSPTSENGQSTPDAGGSSGSAGGTSGRGGSGGAGRGGSGGGGSGGSAGMGGSGGIADGGGMTTMDASRDTGPTGTGGMAGGGGMGGMGGARGIDAATDGQTDTAMPPPDARTDGTTDTNQVDAVTGSGADAAPDAIDAGVVDAMTDATMDGAVDAAPPAAAGLRGEYFDNPDWTESKLVRVDPVLDFAWANAESPDPSIATDAIYSARWTGSITPTATDTYVLCPFSNDEVTVFVSDMVVATDPGQHTSRYPMMGNLTPIMLTANQAYNIRIDWFQMGGTAEIRLRWASGENATCDVATLIPSSVLTPAP